MTRRPVGRTRTVNTETPTRAEVESQTSADDAPDCHELFLQQDDDDLPIPTRLVSYISIVRIAPMRETAGRAFEIVEVPNAQAIRARFGGGTYQVRGLTSKRHYLPGSLRAFTFSGPAFPMDGNGPPEPAPEPPAPLAPPPAQPNETGALLSIMLATMKEAADDRRAQMAMLSTMMQRAMSPVNPIDLEAKIQERADQLKLAYLEGKNDTLAAEVARRDSDNATREALAQAEAQKDNTLGELAELGKVIPGMLAAFKGSPNGGGA